MKKVLVLMHTLGIGGMEKVLINVVNNINARKYKFYIAYVRDGDYRHFIKPHIELIKLPNKPTIFLPKEVLKIVEKESIDILLHSWPKFAVYSYLQSTFLRKKLFTAFRVPISLSHYLEHNKIVKNPLTKRIISNTLNSSDVVITLCQEMEKELVEKFDVQEQKLKTIYNPVDIKHIHSVMNEYNPFEKSNKINIVSIGRLEYQKGFDILIHAYKKVLKEIPNTQLTIVGSGSLKNKLQKLAKKLQLESRIQLLPWTLNPYPYIHYADLLVLPSRYEGFPNILLEALACGTKIVASDCPTGPKEIIGENEQYGWLAQADNPDNLSKKIIEAIKTDINKKPLIDRAKEFDIKKIVKHYEDILDKGEKPRILIFTPKLGGGGAEKISVLLANKFSEHFDTSIAYIENGPYAKELADNIKKIKLKSKHTRWVTFEIEKIYRFHKPDIIFTTQPHATLAVVLWKILRDRPVKTIARLQNPPKNTIKNPIKKRLYKLSITKPNVLIAQCQDMKEELQKHFDIPTERLHIIHNPVDIDKIHKNMKTFNPYKNNKKNDKSVNILSVARLEYEKGIDILLRAFKIVKNQIPNAELTILGSGSCEAELKKMVSSLSINDSVHFIGWQDNPYPYMHYADVVVLSSRKEGLPNTLLEALACGSKVVATDCPTGPAEILGKDEKYGWLAPVENPQALAQKILQALKEPPKQNVQKYINEQYNLEKQAQKYIKIIYTLLKT